jgi:hypothetical protein
VVEVSYHYAPPKPDREGEWSDPAERDRELAWWKRENRLCEATPWSWIYYASGGGQEVTLERCATAEEAMAAADRVLRKYGWTLD